jgi:hypothetical protein
MLRELGARRQLLPFGARGEDDGDEQRAAHPALNFPTIFQRVVFGVLSVAHG